MITHAPNVRKGKLWFGQDQMVILYVVIIVVIWKIMGVKHNV